MLPHLAWQIAVRQRRRWLAGRSRRRAPKIRQLTDVSHCKLQQYLCCNNKIARQLA